MLAAVTEMLVNVLSLKDDDLADEGDEKIKPGSGIFAVYECINIVMCTLYIVYMYVHAVVSLLPPLQRRPRPWLRGRK